MKNKKLSLSNLKVNSFVTQKSDALQGGKSSDPSIQTIDLPTALSCYYYCPPSTGDTF